MASGDKTRLALYSEVETVSTNVENLTTTVESLDSTINTTSTGLVDTVSELSSRVTTIEDEESTIFTVGAIYDADTTMEVASAEDDMLVIFTETPSDLATYFSSGVANDVWKLTSGVFSLYLSYSDSPASIAVDIDSDGTTTYIKQNDSWIESGTGSSSSSVGGVTVKNIYATTTMASVSTSGYYIWTTLPSDYTDYFTEGDISANDILYFDGDNWILYLAYDSAPSTVYVDGGIVYNKYQGSWVDYTSFISSVTSQSLSNVVYTWQPTSSTTISASGVVPFNTSDDTFNTGDNPISNSSGVITLSSGYLYTLTAYAGDSADGGGSGFYLYNNTKASQLGFMGQMTANDQTSNVNISPAFGRLDLTSDTTDTTISVIIVNSETFDAVVDAPRFTVVINQVSQDSVKIISNEDVEVTNNATATQNQILISNGDETTTFVDASDASLIGYNSTAQTIDCDDITTAGIYAITKSSTNLPTYANSASDYYVLQVYTYGTTNGVQILRAADRDSASAVVSEYSRSWESGSFTNWYSHVKISDASAITSGEILVASDAYGTAATGISAALSGSLTLNGNFGIYQDLTVNSTVSTVPSTPAAGHVTPYRSSTTATVTLSWFRVIKTPIGNGAAKVDMYGYWSAYSLDQYTRIYLPSGLFTTFLGIDYSIAVEDVELSSTSYGCNIYCTGSATALYFNRTDYISGSTPFYFHATGYDSGYTVGSIA